MLTATMFKLGLSTLCLLSVSSLVITEADEDSPVNSTINCTNVAVIVHPFSSVFAAVCSLNVLTNLPLMGSVRITASLKGITGWLMINEQLSSLLFQLCFACAVILTNEPFTELIFLAMVKGFHLATVTFLTLQNFNMYLAVCRPTSSTYRRFKSSRCSLGIVLFTWTLAAVNCGITMQEIFVSIRCVDGIRRIRLTKEGLLVPVLSLTYGVFIQLVSTPFFYAMVYKKASVVGPILSLRQTQRRLQTNKRAKFILINSICSSLIFFTLTIFNTSVTFMSIPPSPVKIGQDICWTLLLVYSAFRPVIYYTCYKPIWDATKQRLCRERASTVNAITIAVIPR